MDRWNTPVPISKWSPKVLNATERAPACPQPPCGGVPSILCPPVVKRKYAIIYSIVYFLISI